MRLLKKIQGVSFHKLCDGKLYYTTNGSKPFWMSLHSEEKLLVLDKVSLTMFFPMGDTILFARWKEPYTYELNLQTGVERVVRDEVVQAVSEQYINYRNTEKRTNSYVSRILGTCHVLPYILWEFLPDGGIAQSETEVFRVDWDGNILWSFPFEALGDDNIYSPGEVDHITNILGIVGDLLWFTTEFARLIALDVATGKPVYQLSCNVADKDKSQYKMVEGIGDCYLREEDKVIVCISSFHFQVIEASSGEVIECFAFREEDPDGIGRFAHIYAPLLQGDYFTFLAEMKTDGYGRGRVGIFDYKARKLVWTEEVIPREERMATRNRLIPSQPLYISGDKLYIKDIQDTLYIFQREC